jgi:hypothetical protein
MSRRKGTGPFFVALGLLAGTSILELAQPSGLRGQFFLGSQFAGAPVRSSLDSRFSAYDLSRRWGFRPPDAFSVQWSGYLFVDRGGVYTFTVVADDGSRLVVDRRPVIDERGQGPGTRSGQVTLDRGIHEIVLQYVQLGGAYHLEVLWAQDGVSQTSLPAWVLSPRPRPPTLALALRWSTPAWWALVIVVAALGVRLLIPFVVAWPRRREASGEPEAAARAWVRSGLACFALFVGFAAVQTWPLATDPAHLSRNDNADTVLNEWILSWIAYQLPRDPARLFDANIFHPEAHTLAYSEPLIVQGVLAAPLIWLGASPVLAYNLVLIAGLALTGWAMALVVARWTGDWVAAVGSGILVAFNSHTLTRLPHLQAQHAEFIPLALLALDALLRRPRWSAAIWLAVWFSLQALTSIYLLAFTTLALAVSVIARPEDWLGERFARVAPKLVTAGIFALVVLLPMLVPYWRMQQAGFGRSLDEVAWFSASLKDYWSTPSRLHGALGTSGGGSTSLFPGIAGLLLAGVTIMPGGRACADRRIRMTLAFGLAAVALSFGPIVPGYPQLYALLPPLQAIRGAARFGHLALIALAIVAGFGLASIRRRLGGRPRTRFALSWLAIALVFFEPFVAPITFQPFRGIRSIYRLVASEERAVVAELPFPPPEAIFRNAPYMLGATLNFKPLLNGYSGFVPPSYVDHYLRLASFPSSESVVELRRLGVTHVFVHLDQIGPGALTALSTLPGLSRMQVDEPVALYRVDDAGADAPAIEQKVQP